jgi:hypothetical protein
MKRVTQTVTRPHASSTKSCESSTRHAAAPPTFKSRVQSLQSIHRLNVFPTMKVTFGTYPDNVGHITSSGCFRCHDGTLTAKDGSTINADCEYCHKQIDTASR